MSYRFVNVKRYKRGANWPGGETRTCTRCRIDRSRARQATVVADIKYSGSKYRTPVAYCDLHTPLLLRPTYPLTMTGGQ